MGKEGTMDYDKVIGQAFSAVWRYKSLALVD
jgi:hypothetical protein